MRIRRPVTKRLVGGDLPLTCNSGRTFYIRPPLDFLDGHLTRHAHRAAAQSARVDHDKRFTHVRFTASRTFANSSPLGSARTTSHAAWRSASLRVILGS